MIESRGGDKETDSRGGVNFDKNFEDKVNESRVENKVPHRNGFNS